jgi:hypothetical protein
VNFRPIKVQIPDRLLRRFKTLSKDAFPKETFAYLIGHAAGDNVEIVELFVPDDVDRYATPGRIHPHPHWHDEARSYAQEHLAEVIGDIHSHPYRRSELGTLIPDRSQSEQDLDSGGSWISGICVVTEGKDKRRRARVRFWGPIVPVIENIIR